MKKPIILLIFAALAVGGYFGYRHWETGRRREDAGVLILYGNMEVRRVNLGFRVSDRISEIRFEEGDAVGYISPEAEFTPKNVETTELRTDLVYRVI